MIFIIDCIMLRCLPSFCLILLVSRGISYDDNPLFWICLSVVTPSSRHLVFSGLVSFFYQRVLILLGQPECLPSALSYTVPLTLTRSSPPEASIPNLGLNLTHLLGTPSTPPLCSFTIGSRVIHLGFTPGTILGPCNFSSPSIGLRSHTHICPSPDPEITNFESPLQLTSSPLCRFKAVWPRKRRTMASENASRM